MGGECGRGEYVCEGGECVWGVSVCVCGGGGGGGMHVDERNVHTSSLVPRPPPRLYLAAVEKDCTVARQDLG